MDRIKKYKEIIDKELSTWVRHSIADMPDVEYQYIKNKANNQFILLVIGWHNDIYRHNLLIHIQIRNNQIWIQEDKTGESISKTLQEKGIPRSIIIHGFEEPILRAQAKMARA